jgi:hypothetical protein
MKILSLTVNEFTGGLEHLIEFVHWEYEGIKSSTKLSPPKKIFKPLAEVTEEQIVAWVWSQDRAKIEKFLSNKKIAKTVEFGSVPELSEEAEAAKRDYWVDWATKRLAQYVSARRSSRSERDAAYWREGLQRRDSRDGRRTG